MSEAYRIRSQSGVAGQSFDHPDHHTVLQLFETRVALTPEAPAATHGAVTLSYRELDERANAVAHVLHEHGVGRGDFVPLVVDGGLELLLSMVASMKLAAAFVPVDDTSPVERVVRMIATLDAKVVLRSQRAPEPPVDVPVLTVHPLDLAPRAEPPSVPAATLDDVVYGFYTSGSTGLPKCTVNVHRGLRNRFAYMSRRLSSRADEVVLQNSRHQFDSSLWQMLWPLTTGSQVVIPERSGILDLEATVDVIHRHAVTTTDFVPSIFNTLVELLHAEPDLIRRLSSLRRLLIGGEEMTADAVRAFRSYLPDVSIINTYGPTEASIGSVFHVVCDTDRDPVPIGTPIDNTYAVIVDDLMRPVPGGETGEICIGGECLGLGYVRDPGKTARVFVPNPFPEIPGDRLYRTGDLGYRRPDGLLQFVGRRDHQVKIGGVRIELSEVEAGLLRHPQVREAKVIVHGEGDLRALVAFVTVRSPETGPTELREHARAQLPPALVPRRHVVLQSMPLTPNGKADRKELQRLAAESPAQPAAEAGPGQHDGEHGPGTPEQSTAAEIRAIWQDFLPVKNVDPGADFFDLGGDSLGAQRLAVALTERFGIRVSVRDVFERPTAPQLAALLAGGAQSPRADAPEEQAAREGLALLAPDTVLPEDIVALGTPCGPSEPREVLLTGATGFVGGQLLHDLLERTTADVHCLVRAENPETARHRVVANLREYRLWDDAYEDRIKAVPGDLRLPRLGLTEAEFTDLARHADTIVHNGAMVHLARGYQAHRGANVAGTLEILRLTSAHRRKQLHFISTLGVFPHGEYGTRLIPEGPVHDDLVPDDGYSQSKWVAERLLAEAADRGLDITVHRFGEVTPHSTTGVPSRRGLHDLLVKAWLQTGMSFASPIATDYTPVDWVSALVVAAVRRGERGWLHAVQPHAVGFDALMAVFQREFGLTEVPYSVFHEQLRRSSAEAPDDHDLVRVLALLPSPADDEAHVKESLAELFRQDPAEVARERAGELAAASGMTWPPVGEELFRRYAAYYRSVGW
ncbi:MULTISPECIES: non-ribosomal peptide synthetase [Streptomyces]|uniref:Amino acid adenylation protein n=1 Tax=Streptomyces venezuelae TaxID=54571 RepID=A0A5P2BFG2_STRVZ|nr:MULTISPECIES: non-ribosomal peptide synthetase [Streptomyces]NEA05602.1 amino acid adenylation domain-containing protein [Streptomyces sp. SID10116]MYY82921.1 amino acid adenylation domain-containing protein [Streptomyces sp. SID335]MYZ17011.1 amino acid adenylation domain-containing protein [Streptomyces sp. SID337]NDZ84942.1 amino acid adenylation domain-containing protein [Streptomyces sp. SID10115]NEB45313.1 amino acid adenylation domain-containing protein [Streptomyces sp. SID339]